MNVLPVPVHRILRNVLRSSGKLTTLVGVYLSRVAPNSGKVGEGLEKGVRSIIYTELDVGGPSAEAAYDKRPHLDPAPASHSLHTIRAKEVEENCSPWLLLKMEPLRRKISQLLAKMLLPKNWTARTFARNLLCKTTTLKNPGLGPASKASI